ncbi:MAG: HNH endonuclease [Nanoarchaeota archaeon]
MTNCEICGEIVIEPKIKYCSKECRDVAFRQISNKRNEKKRLMVIEKLQSIGLINCKMCKKGFTPNYTYQKFCSKECNALYRREGNYNKIYKEIKLKKSPISTICKFCKKVFIKEPRYIYCSDECSKKDRLSNKKTTNYSKFEKEFDKFKKQHFDFYDCYNYILLPLKLCISWCLIRDDFSCKKCGTKKNLSIHHIDKKGFALPFNKRNNKLDNLITLCNLCHNNIESDDVRIENYINQNNLTNYIFKTNNKIKADIIITMIRELPIKHQGEILNKL